MPTNVVMPQMGESVAEGTVVRWIKKVGDTVDRDEPLFEISTDKVDAEIPSPVAGVLLEIRAREGDTVPIDTVVAVLGDAGSVPVAEPAAPPPTDAQADGTPGPAQDTSVAAEQAQPQDGAGTDAEGDEAVADDGETLSLDEDTAARRRQKSSPLVRRIAAEHQVNLAQVTGSGISGRVTKQDILKFLDDRQASPAARPGAGLHIPAFQPGEPVDIQPLSVMRRKIAEHMVYSRRTSAHVHTVFEVDFTKVAAARQAQKAEFERAGAKLTFLAFIAKAVADALRATPILNAALDDGNIVYKKDVNLGFAVALDWGLVVPVVPKADEKSLLGLAKGIADVAGRARAKQLKPADVQGGTFTITNPGSFGAQFGMPIINQPQVAILGVGTIEKRVVVVDDMIGIRQRGYLTLGFDHRLVDGVTADEFMSRVKARLESWG